MTRRNFSNPTKRAASERANGVCECHRVPGMTPCGRPLGPGNRFYEHIIPDRAGGDNSLENCAVLTKTCWRIKTDGYDRPHVDKTKRLEDRDIGITRGTGRGFYKPPGTKFNWRGKRYEKGDRR